MYDTGCLGLVHWDDPEGWNGEGGGRRVQDGASSETGMSGNFGGPIKGAKYRFVLQDGTWDFT